MEMKYMATDDCKLTLEEKEVRKAIYCKYIAGDNSFWNNLSRKFKIHCSETGKKQVTQPFIDIVKAWLFNCPHQFKVKRDAIYFGNYEKDGWCYYYNWVKGQFGTIVRQLLDEEEMEERRKQNQEKNKKKELQKCKQWGLDPNLIGTIFQNNQIADLKIRWDGIHTSSRKFPIKFFDMREKSDKMMTLKYFKEHYYKGA